MPDNTIRNARIRRNERIRRNRENFLRKSNYGLIYDKIDLIRAIDDFKYYPKHKANPDPRTTNLSEEERASGATHDPIGLLFRREGLNFNIEVVLYPNERNSNNYNDILPKPVTINHEGVRLDNIFERNYLVIPRGEIVTDNRKLEFWSDDYEIDFVFFGRFELETILNNYSQILISGSEIDYGIGSKSYNNPQINDTSKYPTLKAEGMDGSNSQPYTFGVTKGLPCPPIWSDTDICTMICLNVFCARQRQIKLFPLFNSNSSSHRRSAQSLPNNIFLGTDLETIAEKWTKFVKHQTA